MFESLKNLFKKPYETLDGDTFTKKYKSTKNPILIDVRSPGEFSSGAIRGARNINLSPTFGSTVENLDKSKKYFLYCRSGSRSGSACKTMSALGFEVYNLKGGMNQWRD